MKDATPAYWALVALTLAIYLAMVLWSLPFIAAQAGGLAPFDLRPMGYDLAEAQAFLAALGPAGLERYAGAQAILDSLYPPLLFAVLGIGTWHLSRGLPRPTRFALIAVAAIGMAADGLENVAIREMLAAGPEGVTPEMVARANLMTVAKSSANIVSFAVLAGLLGWTWWRGGPPAEEDEG